MAARTVKGNGKPNGSTTRDRANGLHDLAASFTTSAGTLAGLAQDVADGAERQTRSLDEALSGVNEMNASLKETALHLNDRLDRYGRLLVTRDQARWADDLEMNRRRIELIRQRDAKTYARMIKGRHADGTRMVARLTSQPEEESRSSPARSGTGCGVRSP